MKLVSPRRLGPLLLLAIALVAAPRRAAADKKGPAKDAKDAKEAKDPKDAKEPDGKAEDEARRKDEARAAFERGVKLFGADNADAALAEFRRSMELYPTRAATQNAATALRKLGRFDEALDSYQLLLERFPALAGAEREAVTKEISELEALVGALEIRASESGASVTVDGRPRGTTPLPGPLRVAGGTHTVKVDKDGFKLFETSVSVAGRATVPVVAKLGPLEQAGRLFVMEDRERHVGVVVDGFLRGTTPWEGAVPVGTHTVVLRGEGDVGTPPTPVDVRLNQLTRVSFVAEPLPCTLRVEPTPANATVAVDGVDVGRGLWEGRLRCGGHVIEVLADGFVRQREERSLDRAAPTRVTAVLERVPQRLDRPSAVVAAATVAPVVGIGQGGDLARACSGDSACAGGVERGLLATLGLGYRLGSGLSFGAEAGALYFTANYTDRPETLRPTGREPDRGRAFDGLAHRGPIAGVTIGYARGLGAKERLVVTGALGGGVFVDFYRDDRRGYFQANPAYAASWIARGGSEPPPGSTYDAGGYRATGTVIAPYLRGEVRVGYALSRAVTLDGSLAAYGLLGLSKAVWPSDRAIYAGPGGVGVFGEPGRPQTLASGVVVLFAPGLGATMRF